MTGNEVPNGTEALPQWEKSELPEAPVFRMRQWTMLIGPGLLMAGANIGGGEWLLGPLVTAQYGGRILWLATLSILLQVFFNLCVMRYALYTGESVFVGFFRTPPGRRFWSFFYLFLDLTYFPFLAANAAVPLAAVFLQRLPAAGDDTLVRSLGYGLFVAAFLPLIFGGKIYNSLERIMVAKLVLVLGYLTFVGIFLVTRETGWEILSGLFRFGSLPDTDFSWASLAAFAAVAGAGGLHNAAFSNYARDKGWGMGLRVGAIPSIVGGKTIQLSHTGSVFQVDRMSLARWKGWIRHIRRDQLALWAPACLIGAALPALMSYEFIRGAEIVDGNAMAAMTAQATADRHGQAYWFLTLLCGFLIFFPSQIAALDSFTRRWTDVLWVASKRLRRLPGGNVKYVYYTLLVLYGSWGLLLLNVTPNPLVRAVASGVLMNFGLGFAALHVLDVNQTLLPEQLRPSPIMRAGLVCCALFYAGISGIALHQQWPNILEWLGR